MQDSLAHAAHVCAAQSPELRPLQDQEICADLDRPPQQKLARGHGHELEVRVPAPAQVAHAFGVCLAGEHAGDAAIRARTTHPHGLPREAADGVDGAAHAMTTDSHDDPSAADGVGVVHQRLRGAAEQNLAVDHRHRELCGDFIQAALRLAPVRVVAVGGEHVRQMHGEVQARGEQLDVGASRAGRGREIRGEQQRAGRFHVTIECKARSMAPKRQNRAAASANLASKARDAAGSGLARNVNP